MIPYSLYVPKKVKGILNMVEILDNCVKHLIFVEKLYIPAHGIGFAPEKIFTEYNVFICTDQKAIKAYLVAPPNEIITPFQCEPVAGQDFWEETQIRIPVYLFELWPMDLWSMKLSCPPRRFWIDLTLCTPFKITMVWNKSKKWRLPRCRKLLIATL